jgi:hypothetical protein
MPAKRNSTNGPRRQFVRVRGPVGANKAHDITRRNEARATNSLYPTQPVITN